jgi:hypothetical protein
MIIPGGCTSWVEKGTTSRNELPSYAEAVEGTARRSGFAPEAGKDIFQKFALGETNSNATMDLPSPPGRIEITLHSAFWRLFSLIRRSVCPTATLASNIVNPPWPLTQSERVWTLNFSLLSVKPWTVKSAKTETRGVRRRSMRRK